MLLDEPTAALDIGHQQQALELLDVLARGIGLTLVAAMHDLTLAAQYADRMLLLDGGRVVADGAPADVLTEALIASHYGAHDRRRARSATGVAVVRASVATHARYLVLAAYHAARCASSSPPFCRARSAGRRASARAGEGLLRGHGSARRLVVVVTITTHRPASFRVLPPRPDRGPREALPPRQARAEGRPADPDEQHYVPCDRL